jgi:hypothetical protein
MDQARHWRPALAFGQRGFRRGLYLRLGAWLAFALAWLVLAMYG